MELIRINLLEIEGLRFNSNELLTFQYELGQRFWFHLANKLIYNRYYIAFHGTNWILQLVGIRYSIAGKKNEQSTDEIECFFELIMQWSSNNMVSIVLVMNFFTVRLFLICDCSGYSVLTSKWWATRRSYISDMSFVLIRYDWMRKKRHIICQIYVNKNVEDIKNTK